MAQDLSFDAPLTTVFIPGLACTPALYASQLQALWEGGAVFVADHCSDDSVQGIAQRLLATAPPRFRLVGLSMGGYVAFEVMRQAPERVVALALLDTTARPDTDEQRESRQQQVELARAGSLAQVMAEQYPKMVHPSRQDDAALKALVTDMGRRVGAAAYARQQTAIAARPDSRRDLGAITCPTLVLVGDGDALTPPDRAREMADAIRDSELVVVPECGHLSALERPQAVDEALLKWARLS